MTETAEILKFPKKRVKRKKRLIPLKIRREVLIIAAGVLVGDIIYDILKLLLRLIHL
jgi:hypothetical protein